MFDSFIVWKPEIDPKLPAYRRFWLRHKGGIMLIYWLAVWAGSIYDIYNLFRVK